jgi:hypothetical protein
VKVYRDAAPDFKAILDAERNGRYTNRTQEESGNREDMAVLGKTSPLHLHVAHVAFTGFIADCRQFPRGPKFKIRSQNSCVHMWGRG